MKKMRFVVIATIVALLLGSFFVAPGTAQSVAGTAPQPSLGSTAMDIPVLSPFLFGASAQVVAAGAISPENNTIGYSCLLTKQTPADWTTMRKRTIFDAKWTLKNTGSKVWGIHGVDVVYRGGTSMHTSRGFYDLPKQVGPGQSITIIEDMIAPKLPGYYVSNWGLYLGSLSFCRFYIVIYVSG